MKQLTLKELKQLRAIIAQIELKHESIRNYLNALTLLLGDKDSQTNFEKWKS